MKRVLSWLLHPVVLGVLGLVALSALVWWVGPLLPMGSSHPLDPTWVRVLIIAVLWLAGAARLGWAAWRRKQLNAALVKGIAADAGAAEREAQVLAQRFDEAVKRLRSGTRRSLLQPGAYLYDLPWYVFIGAPAAGKTTALLNSGLQFLLGDSAAGGEAKGPAAAAIQGVGGTRNCDWWLTRDAVLIDTAGRYTTQESDASVDARAWDNFLSLLKRTRPRQPINGVLLTVSVRDLLNANAAERAEHAGKLRERLHELLTKLGVAAPVYVLVTMADLIAGFNETFGDLPREQRDQVWGFTFAWSAQPGADALAGFDAGFKGLEQRLADSLPERLLAARETSRRAALFGFVQEFAALRPLLQQFLGQVFAAGGQVQRTPPVRGVYFTSGTQEGNPIDRVMGALGRSFGLARQSALLPGGQGKSFFLLKTLSEVVIAERGLGAWNEQAEQRRRTLRWAGLGALGVATVALLVGWSVSVVRNQSYVDQVAARVPALRQAIEQLPAAPAGDVATLIQPLSDLRAAARPADWPLANPPLSASLGLYQGDKLDAGARMGYERVLKNAFGPRVALRLEERLRAANKDNLENAYEALKSYVMLHQRERLDSDALRGWIAADWDTQYARSLTPEQRQALDGHLDAWLALGAPAAAAPQDAALVASVREMLVAYPLEYRVYSRLRRASRGNDVPEFTVAGAAGPRAAQVFERASREPLTKGIPGLFTREGYRKTFQQAVGKASAQLAAEESWVLGLKNDATRIKDAALGTELANRVRRLYLQDYIKQWDAYLADVRLQPMNGLERSVEIARLLAGVDSPLVAFVRRVAEETQLVPPAAAPATGVAAALADKARAAKEEAARLADAGAAPAAGGAAGPVERMVDDHFASYHRLVQGQPAPIDDLRKLFEEVHAQLVAIDSARKAKAPPPPAGGGDKIKAAAGGQPEPIRAMLETLADAGAKGSRAAERDVLSAELKPITEFCQKAIANRYPFATSAVADALPDDFGRVFGTGGQLDEFFQRYLQTLVDKGTAVWSYKPLPDGTRPPSPAALAEFQRAARIRDTFFGAGGRTPGFKLDIRALEFTDGLKELTLDIDGQAFKLTAGGPAITVTGPSPRAASRITLNAQPALARALSFDGPWALFRLFDRFDVQMAPQGDRFSLTLNVDGRKAKLEVLPASSLNPYRLREMQQFRCPGAM